MADASALLCKGLSRRFGGVQAVDSVSLRVEPSSIHAVIGTNGAGKSTLLNLLAGEVRPDEGSIHLGDRPIHSLTQAQRAQIGIGRTYQRSTLFEDFSVFENCRISAQSRLQRPWALLEPALRCTRSSQAAREAIAIVGLDDCAERIAGSLSHGQKRQLEIAMCIAQRPRVLLLDEPLAGMGAAESERMQELLQQLKRLHAIVLVEHDMSVVFQVADALTVMVNGRAIAQGMPNEIRSNPQVISAYLGDDHG